MFKRYKIRKAKQFNEINVTKKSLKINPEYTEKSEIQKIKLLLKNSNKSNAYKRIANLLQEDFDRYLHFICKNVMSEFLETDDSVLTSCVRRILNSKRFFSINDLFVGYMDVIKDDKFIELVKKHQYRIFANHFKGMKEINLGSYKYDDVIVLCQNKV